MRTVRTYLALGAAALLVACASGESLTDRIAGSNRVQGDADGVSVSEASSAADALPLAVGHCSHFKKSAQYESHDGTRFKFRCVQG